MDQPKGILKSDTPIFLGSFFLFRGSKREIWHMKVRFWLDYSDPDLWFGEITVSAPLRSRDKRPRTKPNYIRLSEFKELHGRIFVEEQANYDPNSKAFEASCDHREAEKKVRIKFYVVGGPHSIYFLTKEEVERAIDIMEKCKILKDAYYPQEGKTEGAQDLPKVSAQDTGTLLELPAMDEEERDGIIKERVK